MDSDSGPPQPADVLYLDYAGSPYPLLSRFAGVPGIRALVGRLTDDSMFRRHPRDADYMRELVRFAHGHEYVARIRQVGAAADLETHAIETAALIVLLWRDGNGTGWWPLERRVLRHKAKGAQVMVLNGRRRQFDLTPEARRAFMLRRFLGKGLFVEGAFLLTFLVSSPFLFAWDRIRGHR